MAQLDDVLVQETGSHSGMPQDLKDTVMSELASLAPDVDELFSPGFHAHLTGAFVDMFHGQVNKARQGRKLEQLHEFDIDALLQVDSTLTSGDRAVLKSGINDMESHLHQVDGILKGHPHITEKPQHPRTAAETLHFVLKANHLEGHLKVQPLAERRDLFKVSDSRGGSDKSLYLRRTVHGGWEWSPKSPTTCWAFVKTAEPPCWFHSRAKTHAPYIKLVDHLKAHQNLPVHVTADQKPSVGETIEALGFGFVNGLFMGMGDLFRNAFRHTDCDGAGAAVSATSAQFGKALKTSGRCIKDILTLKKDSHHCQHQASEWKALMHRLKHLFSLCKTLQRTIGVIIVVILVALVAVKIVTTLIGSAAGPIGAFIGAAVGVIVKIGMIVLAAVTGLHFMAKTVRKFVQARRRCHHGPCIKRDIVAMIEAGMEFIGVWVGIIAFSGLDKVIDMPKFRALFRGQRPRFQPKFLKELEQLKLAYHNAKHGQKVPLNIVDDVADDVVRHTDNTADDATKAVDDVVDDTTKAVDDVVDDTSKAVDDVADDSARQAEEAAQRQAKEAAERRARAEAERIARIEKEAAEAAKRAKKLSDEAAHTATHDLNKLADDIAEQERLAAQWRPDGTYSLHRKRIHGDHYGRTEVVKQYTPQHNPYTAKIHRLRKQYELGLAQQKKAQQAAQVMDEAAKVADDAARHSTKHNGYNFGTKSSPTDRFGVPEYMRKNQRPKMQFGRRTTGTGGATKGVSGAVKSASKAAKLKPAQQAEFAELVKVMENTRSDYISMVKGGSGRTSAAFRGIDVKVGNLAEMHKSMPTRLNSVDDALQVFNEARNALMKFEKAHGLEVFYQARLDQLVKAGDVKAIAEYKALHGLNM
eukprot:TRINITY_DN1114_c0_g2_i2.p1 TRINITY_DN1114_c0_g2~~TRINITY_DN1114_c0_g2_i2.p1  ORF type:complete len:867 (+),score=318.94 TRINITY_DN1114_c0_g2_i2:608-3208(+)